MTVTASGQTMTSQKESEEQLRLTSDELAIGIAQISPKGNYLYVNEKFCKILGYFKDDMLALTIQDNTFAEDVETCIATLNDLFSGRKNTYALEQRCIRMDRSVVWCHLTFSLKKGPTGSPHSAIILLEDITKRKRLEKASTEAIQENELY